MDQPTFKSLRIAPTTQQGGTQTIQQSIYLTHNNPCGANLLIFQEMGLTKIRYIDLKNYLDGIVGSEEMRLLFEEVRAAATEYIANPTNKQFYYKYLYMIMSWGLRSIANLAVPIDYYPGYRFRVDVYDSSGVEVFDSFAPAQQIIRYNSTTGKYELGTVPLVPSQVDRTSPTTFPLYKLSGMIRRIGFIDSEQLSGFAALLSNYAYNQSGLPENVMAIASLLVDSANTRSFGIPKFGFSARENISGFGGLSYNCVNFIDIRTLPDENGNTTLVTSIFFRLSLNEDTYGFDAPAPTPNLSAPFVPLETPPPIKTRIADLDIDPERLEEIMTTAMRRISEDLGSIEENARLFQEGRDDEVLYRYAHDLLPQQPEEE